MPTKADPDIRMKDCGTHYEYSCVYVDDVMFIAKDLMDYFEVMQYEYNLKGVGVPESYLGGDMEIHEDGHMAWSPSTYIKTITERIERLLESSLRSWQKSYI